MYHGIAFNDFLDMNALCCW